MYNNSLENIKNVYSDVALVYNLETEKTNSLATETYNLLTNVTSNVTTLKNKISILGDMLTDLRVLNGSAKNIIPLTDLKIIENNGIRIKDNKFELNYINNELKEIDANLSSITSVVPYNLYSLDGKESYLTDLLKTKSEVKIKFPNKNYTFELNLRYQSVEQINTIALQLGLLTESYPDILSIKYIDTDNTLKDIIILDTNTRNYSLNDNRVKDNLYIFNITPVATDQIIIELSSRDSDSLIVKGIETYYSNILQNGYIILGPVTTEDPILKLAIDSTNITSGVKIEVSTDKDYWIELNNSSSIGLNGTKKILSINTIGNNSIKNDQDIYSIYIKISIASSILSNENLDISVYNTLREDSTIGNDLLNSIEDIRLSAYRVSSSDFNYGNYMYSSAINLLKFPLDKIETIQNNGVSKVLGLVESKYSITNSSNTTNVIGSVGAELKLHRLNADKTIDASGFDLANSVVHDVYPRYIEETINIKQKDNLCLMLKQRNKNNLPSIPEAPNDSTIIATSYDGFYQTMTVTGDPGLEVATKDSEGNVIGSGVIDDTGTVTYSINEGMLLGGSIISTSAVNSNIVDNSLVASFYSRNYKKFDTDGNYIYGTGSPMGVYVGSKLIHFDYDYDWTAIPPGSTGRIIFEHTSSSGLQVIEEYTLDQIASLGQNWIQWASPNDDNSYIYNSENEADWWDLRIRVEGISCPVHLAVESCHTTYKFFDDGVSDVAYRLSEYFYNSTAIDHLPAYLPSNLTRLSGMFMGRGSEVFTTPEAASNMALWDTTNVVETVYMFSSTDDINFPVSTWNLPNLERADGMFEGTLFSGTGTGDLSSWHTPKLSSAERMFEATECASNLVNWCVPLIPEIPDGFNTYSNITSEMLPHWGACGNSRVITATYNSVDQSITVNSNVDTTLRSYVISGYNKIDLGTGVVSANGSTTYYLDTNLDELRSINSQQDTYSPPIKIFTRGVGTNTVESNLVIADPRELIFEYDKSLGGMGAVLQGGSGYSYQILNESGTVLYTAGAGGSMTFTTSLPSGIYKLRVDSFYAPYYNIFYYLWGQGIKRIIKFPDIRYAGIFLRNQTEAVRVPNLIGVPLGKPYSDCSSLFRGCSLLNDPNIAMWKFNENDYLVMNYMFKDCTAFNQDLSNWCVPNISTMPVEFNSGAPLLVGAKLPVWGTCPVV